MKQFQKVVVGVGVMIVVMVMVMMRTSTMVCVRYLHAFFEGLLAQSSSLPALSMEAMFW